MIEPSQEPKKEEQPKPIIIVDKQIQIIALVCIVMGAVLTNVLSMLDKYSLIMLGFVMGLLFDRVIK